MICSFAYKNDDQTEMNFCSTALNTFESRLVPKYIQAVRVLRGNSFAITIMSGKKVASMIESGVPCPATRQEQTFCMREF